MFKSCIWAEKPYSTNWYIAPYLKQAKEIAWDRLLAMLPRKSVFRIIRSECKVVLRNRASIMLKGADTPDSLRGPGIDSAVLDECRFMYPFIWDEIITAELMKAKGPALFLSTPKGKGWFWKLTQREKVSPHIWKSFNFTSFDNPHIDKTELLETEKNTPLSIWEEEFLAKVSEHQGLVYPRFVEQMHVIPPFHIPESWQRYEGMDWGISNPTVFIFCAVSPKTGNIYFYDEHYRPGWTARQHSIVVRIKRGQNKCIACIADPTVYNKSGGDLNTVASDFAKEKIFLVKGQAKPKSRAIGIVTDYLIGPKPRVFFFARKLPNTVREFGMYEKSDIPLEYKKNMLETPQKAHDHAMNALEYVLTYIHDRHMYTKFPLPMSETLRKRIDIQTAATQRLPLRRRKHGPTFDTNTGYLS